ncbi:MAG: hypothetical protein JWL61_2791 [Gemmatimonadetes bacterium]|nr:hypothetical protein [Gemmatimonadota bacterium]
MDESQPETQADGGMNPPPRVPPMALATADGPSPHRRMLPTLAGPRGVTALVNRALDQLDTIADRIAHAAGLR